MKGKARHLAFMRPVPAPNGQQHFIFRLNRLLLTLAVRGSIRLQILICPVGNGTSDQNDCVQPNANAGVTAGTTTGRGTVAGVGLWVTGL